ncbi:MAG: hypothetical protein AAB537_01295 [Patescibacteria group bacterium]
MKWTNCLKGQRVKRIGAETRGVIVGLHDSPLQLVDIKTEGGEVMIRENPKQYEPDEH